jgi:hypothetical protein
MSTKVRKQIYIEPEQEKLLKQLSAETGMSEAEIIREAISQHARGAHQPLRRQLAWARISEFLEQRAKLGPIEEGGRTWRREDLYDR